MFLNLVTSLVVDEVSLPLRSSNKNFERDSVKIYVCTSASTNQELENTQMKNWKIPKCITRNHKWRNSCKKNYKTCAYCRNEEIKIKIENNFLLPKSKFIGIWKGNKLMIFAQLVFELKCMTSVVPMQFRTFLRFETFLSFSPDFTLKKCKASKTQNLPFSSEIGIFQVEKKSILQKSMSDTREKLFTS